MIIEKLAKYINGKSELGDSEIEQLVDGLKEQEAERLTGEVEELMYSNLIVNEDGDATSIFDEELDLDGIQKSYDMLETEKLKMFKMVSSYIEEAYKKTIENNRPRPIKLNDFVSQFASNLSMGADVNSWIERKLTREEGLPEQMATIESLASINLLIINKIIRNNYKLLKAIDESRSLSGAVKLIKKENSLANTEIGGILYIEGIKEILNIPVVLSNRDINSADNVITKVVLDTSQLLEVSEYFKELSNRSDSDEAERVSFLWSS